MPNLHTEQRTDHEDALKAFKQVECQEKEIPTNKSNNIASLFWPSEISE